MTEKDKPKEEEEFDTLEGSWLRAKYVYKDKRLVVYIGSDAYECVDVPKDVWDEFKLAPSKGSYFNRNIRGKYNHSMFS